MDIDKALEVVTNYAVQYIVSFVDIISSPKHRFNPERQVISEESRISLNSQTIIFAVLSIIIGSVLFNNINNPIKQHVDITWILVIMICVCWLAFSFFIHLVCKLLGSQQPFIGTASVCMQILSVAFLVSNFLAFFIAGISIYVTTNTTSVANFSYILFQLIFLCVYWSMALSSFHQFNYLRGAIVGIFVAFCFVTLNILLFILPYLKAFSLGLIHS